MTLDQLNAMDAAPRGEDPDELPWNPDRGRGSERTALGNCHPLPAATGPARGVHCKFGSKVARKRELGGDLTDASRAEWGNLGLDHLSAKGAVRFERPGVQIRGNSASRFPHAARRRTATSFRQRHPINIDDTGQDHG
jgi:hypothetical protein